jgi:hypothetical protein
MTFEEQDDIAEQARAWVVRLASGEMAESECATLLAWLAESETHARAFEAERAFWQRLAPLQETFERLDRTERSAAAPSPPLRIRRPHIAITGISHSHYKHRCRPAACPRNPLARVRSDVLRCVAPEPAAGPECFPSTPYRADRAMDPQHQVSGRQLCGWRGQAFPTDGA